MKTYRKKIFKHGRSKAIDLIVEVREDGIFI